MSVRKTEIGTGLRTKRELKLVGFSCKKKKMKRICKIRVLKSIMFAYLINIIAFSHADRGRKINLDNRRTDTIYLPVAGVGVDNSLGRIKRVFFFFFCSPDDGGAG